MRFVKYEGAGNDFVIINHLNSIELADVSPAKIAHLCNRRFGIGADGLMIIEQDEAYDFAMRYFNSDGQTSSMCGNGGRCIVSYAHEIGLIEASTTFRAVDGPHQAKVIDPNWIELEMHPQGMVRDELKGYFIDTGSPHYMLEVDDIATVNVNQEGRRWRHHSTFSPGGSNVNFVQTGADGLHIATYERGVEAETLACGTGVTAAALLSAWRSKEVGAYEVPVQAKGGKFTVRFTYDGQAFTDVWLCGPAKLVFSGQMTGNE